MNNWLHAGPTILTAFLASLVEFVEAFTIVLAAGTVRGWRGALTGVAAGIGALALIVAAGGSLLERFPMAELRLAIGVLLLLFGMRWLRKSTLRAAGIISLHDESAAYTSETNALRGSTARRPGIDAVAVVTAFNGVLIEGIEVVFIVIATGAAGHLLVPAAIGALAAGAVVLTAGMLLRVPLTRVPENSLKLAVGVLLSAFGTFWIGEGAGYTWPGDDLSILWLAALYLCSALGIAMAARRFLLAQARVMTGAIRIIGSALQVIVKLFVDDGVYAATTVAWIIAAIAFGSHSAGAHAHDGVILAIGLDLIFTASVVLRIRKTQLGKRKDLNRDA